MNETIESLKVLARFPSAIHHFRRTHLTIEQARSIVRERMARREETFLEIAERSIYNYPASPYRALLNLAGCELGDLRALVKQKGLDDALRTLRAQGVYITFEEYKRRKPLVRGGKTIPLDANSFNNPAIRVHFQGETGGSTGTGAPASSNLEQNLATGAAYLLTYAAHDVLNIPAGLWRGILPDRSGIGHCFTYSVGGGKFDKWFSHMNPRDLKFKYVLATYFMVGVSRLNGLKIPFPQYVSLDDAIVVVNWIQSQLKAHGRCLLSVQVSRALRLSLAAQQAGIDLSGAVFVVAGEPSTPAKIQAIEKCGAKCFPMYTLGEIGHMGMGCVHPLDVSDVHLLHDSFAIITHPHQVPGSDVQVPAFNITTLLPQTTVVMLNVEADDYGTIQDRHCGCYFEELGYHTHIRDIHSYQKLTGEGVSLVGSEMVHILEHVLPARFGGSALDYQLLEQEDERGFTRLYLLISPRIAIQDDQKVIEVVLNALRESSAMADAARTVWQQAGIFQIKRTEPIWTQRGKFMSLRRERLAQ